MNVTGQKKSAPGIVSRLPQLTTNRYLYPGAGPQRLTATEATASIQTGRRTTCPGFRHGTVRQPARSLYPVSGAGQFVHNPGGSKTLSATVFPVSGNPIRTTSNIIPLFGIPKAIPHILRLRRAWKTRNRIPGAGLTFFGIGRIWASILHFYAHALPKARTTSFQLPQRTNPVGKSERNLYLKSQLRFPRVEVFHFTGSHHRLHPFLRLSPFLTQRKHPLGAGLPVLKVSLVWILLLHSAVQAAGPETRITTTPTAAYEPPARTAAETGHETPRTTKDLLSFIRALEAPRGYTDYERRIRITPPKPLTAMTVGEVLDWQVRVRRSGAPSTAAGGYQIIYPTLRRLVAKYGISRSQRFDAKLQDHLAKLLIGECGPRGPRRNHPRYGSCLAGIWAALPLTHGPNRGRSAYHGVAGNRALTHPDTVLDLLAGLPVDIPSHKTRPPVDPKQALARIGRSIRTRPLAFGASRITLQTEDINAALRKARRDNSLTPPLKPAIKTWKQDPYAQN